MNTENKSMALAPVEEKVTALTLPGFNSSSGFELMQRQANAFARSDLVPPQFKGNLPNCIIALEMASRMGASPFAVMQNLYVVHGRPSWSSTFIIATVNSGGCDGALVTMAMAKSEGWLGKNGSKWQTMPELMMRYRAATFWARIYSPETLMGMKTADEVEDIGANNIGFDNAKKITADAPIFDEKSEKAVAKPEETKDVNPEKEPKPRKTKAQPQEATEPTNSNKLTWRDKLGALIDESGVGEFKFEKTVRSLGFMTQSQTLNSVADAVCMEMYEKFNEIVKEIK